MILAQQQQQATQTSSGSKFQARRVHASARSKQAEETGAGRATKKQRVEKSAAKEAAPLSKAEEPKRPTQQDAEEDPVVLKAKQEFLRVMEIMEEAGLVTEKGIGAGMVK